MNDGKRDGWISIVWCLVLCVVLVGCGTPESVRQGNSWIIPATEDQEKNVDEVLAIPGLPAEAKPRLESVKETAGTIRAAAQNNERKLGPPEEPKDYTPQAHKDVVVQGKADLDQQDAVKNGFGNLVEGFVKKIADSIWPGVGAALIAGFLWIRKNIQFDKLKKGTKPIVKVLEDHPEAQEKIKKYASDIGAGAQVKAAVDFLRK